ncbi:MAG: hypothetical protein WBJ13_04325 [Sedimentibacter sp.]
MVIQVTLQELMLLIISVFAIAAGMLLLHILWDIKKVVGILRPIIETNQESIKKTIKTIPGIFENAGHISSNVKETTDKLRISAPVILKKVELASNSAKESIEAAGTIVENLNFGSNKENRFTYNTESTGFMAYLNIFEEILQIVYRTFSSSK